MTVGVMIQDTPVTEVRIIAYEDQISISASIRAARLRIVAIEAPKNLSTSSFSRPGRPQAIRSRLANA